MESIDLVDYSRQADLDQKIGSIKSQVSIIVGCGGIGYWLGIQLAMLGVQHFILLDGDKLDASNLNRLPVPQTWLGHNKAIALSNMIHWLRPLASVVVLQKHITSENMAMYEAVFSEVCGRVALLGILWDCTDNARIQKEIYNRFKRTYIYTKLGYEAMDVGAYTNFDIWIDEANYQPGYRTSNANAVTSAVIAGLGILYRGLGKTQDTNINLETLVGGGYVPREL